MTQSKAVVQRITSSTGKIFGGCGFASVATNGSDTSGTVVQQTMIVKTSSNKTANSSRVSYSSSVRVSTNEKE